MPTENYQIIDPSFRTLVFNNAHVEKLGSGFRWAEGPAYFPAGKYLVWSDIPNDRLMRYDETSGEISEFLRPCNNHNGHTTDAQGRLVSCEHGGRCVSRIEHDGSYKVLASHYEGKRFNSPNDLVIKSDDSIWFSDPSYGIDSDYEGDAAASEIGERNVYRIDPDGTISMVVTDLTQPNGLAFSPDESLLYVADTGFTHDPSCKPKICSYPVSADGKSVGAGEIHALSDAGLFDGFRVDTEGRIWSSAADGVHCFSTDGKLIGKINVPEVVANVCFGGPKRNKLYICGTTSLYAVYVNAAGCAR